MVIATPLVQLQQGPAPVLGLAALALCLVSQAASAQAPKPPVAAQANSTFGYEVKDGQEIVTIANVAFRAIDPYLPGRKGNDRLLLRTTTQTKEAIDDIGVEGSVTVEAWPLGSDLAQKPRRPIRFPH